MSCMQLDIARSPFISQQKQYVVEAHVVSVLRHKENDRHMFIGEIADWSVMKQGCPCCFHHVLVLQQAFTRVQPAGRYKYQEAIKNAQVPSRNEKVTSTVPARISRWFGNHQRNKYCLAFVQLLSAADCFCLALVLPRSL